MENLRIVGNQLVQVLPQNNGQEILVPVKGVEIVKDEKGIVLGATNGQEDKYTFQLPSNATAYNVAFGGFGYLSVYAADSDQPPAPVSGITSDEFPNQSIGTLSANSNPLDQFARLVFETPHIVTRVNINASSSSQTSNSLKLYSGVGKNALSNGAPANIKTINGKIPDQDTMNRNATFYDITGGFLLAGRNFLFYTVNASTSLSLEIIVQRVISLAEVANNVIKSTGN